jgi:serine/threonine protein kinase
MSENDSLKNGTLLGAYKIRRLIGQGGISSTYAARDGLRHRKVALKVISAKDSENRAVVAGFNAAGKALSRLQHKNVVTVHGLGEENGTHYIVMEYVEGHSFNDLVRLKGRLSLGEALAYFKQALEGLQALHEQGLLHQDLKSKNIFVNNEGLVKLVDFGLGKIEGKQFFGAVNYLAPEVILGEAASVSSDIWSLGINFYEVLKGRRPFEDEDGAKVVQNILNQEISFGDDTTGSIDESFRRIIQRMCAKLPERRYASAAEVLRDLVAFEASYSPVAANSEAATLLRTAVSSNTPSLPTFTPPLPPASGEVPRPKSVTGGEHTFSSLLVESEWDYRKMATVAGAIALATVLYFSFQPKSPSSSDKEVVAEVAQEIELAPESPAEGQKMVLRQLEPLQFVWSGGISESTFLEVSRAANFQDLLIDEPFTMSPHMSQKTLPEGSYFWRLVQKTGAQSMPLFEGISFMILTEAPPQAIYPKTEFTAPEGKPVQFYWLNKYGIAHYRFQLSRDGRFESLWSDLLLDGIQTGAINILPGTYYWRVRGEDPPSVTSQWSEVRVLRVQKSDGTVPGPSVAPVAAAVKPAPTVAAAAAKKPAPAATAAPVAAAPPPPPPPVAKKPVKQIGAPKLVAGETSIGLNFRLRKNHRNPASKEAVLLNPPILKWKQAEGAYAYKVQVSKDPSFLVLDWIKTVSTLEVRWESAQPGRYYWRVQATDGEVSSAFSAPAYMDLLIPAPTPVPMLPVPVITKKAPKALVPKAVVRAEPKPVKVAKKKSPTKVAKKIKPSARKMASAEPDEEEEEETDEFLPETREVEAPAPAARALPDGPALKLPPDGVSIVSLSGNVEPISFRWGTLNGADSYHLQVAADANFRLVQFNKVLRDTQFVLTKKMPRGRFFWRVRTEGRDGNSAWSGVYSFEIAK